MDLNDDFLIYYKLWKSAIDFEYDRYDWVNGPFIRLNYNKINKKVKVIQLQT